MSTLVTGKFTGGIKLAFIAQKNDYRYTFFTGEGGEYDDPGRTHFDPTAAAQPDPTRACADGRAEYQHHCPAGARQPQRFGRAIGCQAGEGLGHQYGFFVRADRAGAFPCLSLEARFTPWGRWARRRGSDLPIDARDTARGPVWRVVGHGRS